MKGSSDVWSRGKLQDEAPAALRMYHCPKLPGLGEVNWGRFFSILSDTGYQGAVCVEVEDRAYEKTLALRKLALKQSHDYLRQFLAGAASAV